MEYQQGCTEEQSGRDLKEEERAEKREKSREEVRKAFVVFTLVVFGVCASGIYTKVLMMPNASAEEKALVDCLWNGNKYLLLTYLIVIVLGKVLNNVSRLISFAILAGLVIATY